MDDRLIYCEGFSTPGVVATAVFSADRVYRYELTRICDHHKPRVNFIGLNPSTATHEVDDPTVRREMGFARDWGYGGIIKTNLFAYRATNPRELSEADDPWGEPNKAHITMGAQRTVEGGLIVAAWGDPSSHLGYIFTVEEMLALAQLAAFPVYALRLTKRGYPGHTLYLPHTATPIPYNAAAKAAPAWSRPDAH